MDKKQTRDFRIYITEKQIIIHYLENKMNLLIDRTPFKMSSIQSLEFVSKLKNFEKVKSDALLGIHNINNLIFLVYAKASKYICNINESNIYELEEADYLQISHQNIDDETEDIINSSKKLLSHGFFYSFSFDLTSNQQKTKNNLVNYNRDYLWNGNLMNDFIKFNVDQCFYVNMIYGYIGHDFFQLKENSRIDLILISRKSINNPQQFIYSSGLNSENYTSNFIETEQIIFFDKFTLSFVQFRGTCPISYHCKFDEESKIFKINLKKSFKEIKHNFIENLGNIMKDQFEFIYFINSLSLNRNEDEESKLFENFEAIMEINEISNKCRSTNFDYEKGKESQYSNIDNEQANDPKKIIIEDEKRIDVKSVNLNILENKIGIDEKSVNFDNLDKKEEKHSQYNLIDNEKILEKKDYLNSFLKNIDSVIESFNFFYNDENEEIDHKQIGIFHTICFDSTIKSNFIQSQISLIVLEKFVKYS